MNTFDPKKAGAEPATTACAGASRKKSTVTVRIGLGGLMRGGILAIAAIGAFVLFAFTTNAVANTPDNDVLIGDGTVEVTTANNAMGLYILGPQGDSSPDWTVIGSMEWVVDEAENSAMVAWTTHEGDGTGTTTASGLVYERLAVNLSNPAMNGSVEADDQVLTTAATMIHMNGSIEAGDQSWTTEAMTTAMNGSIQGVGDETGTMTDWTMAFNGSGPAMNGSIVDGGTTGAANFFQDMVA